jgi:hypothetical protein
MLKIRYNKSSLICQGTYDIYNSICIYIKYQQCINRLEMRPYHTDTPIPLSTSNVGHHEMIIFLVRHDLTDDLHVYLVLIIAEWVLRGTYFLKICKIPLP